jgi:amidase
MAIDRSLSRRQVLRYGMAGGALLATGRASSPVAARASARGHDWQEATVAQLQAAMKAGELSATELTKWYLARIDELNPLLGAVIETNPDAVKIARWLDMQRRGGHGRGPLHGIPVIVKDNIATDDRMETTAGSLALVGSRVRRDAPIVTRLRDAGAVVLGKANLSEWANFRGFAPFNGWSARGGFTRNPYVLDLDPCGSSSGSATVVAANLATLAVGTETDGSILCPAGEQNVVGIKPTIGLVSQAGIIPIAASQDTAGPMARTVLDAARLLNVLRTPFGDVAGHRLPRDYTEFAVRRPVRRLRLLVDTTYMGDDLGTAPEVQAVFDEAIDALVEAGARIDRVPLASPLDDFNGRIPFDDEFTVLLFEFKVQVADYLSGLRHTDLRTLADLIAFNLAACDEEMKYFGQEIFELAEATSGDLTDPDYQAALATSRGFSQGVINGVLEQGYDAIVTPTYSFGTTTAATAGYASMAVPVGFTAQDRPVGFWLTAGFLDEPKLLTVAATIEAFFEARRIPELLGSPPPEPADAGICDDTLVASQARSIGEASRRRRDL